MQDELRQYLYISQGLSVFLIRQLQYSTIFLLLLFFHCSCDRICAVNKTRKLTQNWVFCKTHFPITDSKERFITASGLTDRLSVSKVAVRGE